MLGYGKIEREKTKRKADLLRVDPWRGSGNVHFQSPVSDQMGFWNRMSRLRDHPGVYQPVSAGFEAGVYVQSCVLGGANLRFVLLI